MNGNAGSARISKEVINTFIESLILMAIIFAIIALIIFSYGKVVNLLTKDADSMYPIKVSVEDAYSFNTSVTGYMKYMSLMPDYVGQLKSAFMYFLIVAFNFGFFILMLSRLGVVACMIMIAPISVVNYMRGHKAKEGSKITNLLYFNNWLSFFIRIVYAPIFGIIIYRFLILTLA